ncbi:unnamed protein product [Ixodes persulcatus]
MHRIIKNLHHINNKNRTKSNCTRQRGITRTHCMRGFAVTVILARRQRMEVQIRPEQAQPSSVSHQVHSQPTPQSDGANRAVPKVHRRGARRPCAFPKPIVHGECGVILHFLLCAIPLAGDGKCTKTMSAAKVQFCRRSTGLVGL